MDPSNKTTPGFELPSPGAEQGPPAASAGPAETLPQVPEQAPAAVEHASGSQLPALTPPLPSTPLPQIQPFAPVATDDVAATTQPTHLTVNDDGDLIEKAWVEKAKQIVERTRDDPFRQSEELTIFKADYMKKRYGKTIKISQ